MSGATDELDGRLLAAIQRRVPLVARPWRQLAAELGAAEGRVCARVGALGGPDGVIREIAGIFDAPALGYATTLAAARVLPDRLAAAGGIVAGHPGVSHAYARGGELNLWFTLAVGPDSTLGLDGTLEVLRRRVGAERMVSLPAVRRYKLHVVFGGAPSPAAPEAVGRTGVARPAEPAPKQVRAIRALQRPLRAVPEPFDAPARAEKLTADDLLVHASDFLAAGWMRRYAAVLRHRRAGAAVNVLVAWRVPEDRADAFGRRAAQCESVSHCFSRAPAEGWPYNLYTMVHAADEPTAERVVSALAADAGGPPRAVLPTVAEYKKAKVRLFGPEVRRWEAAVSD